MAKSTAVTTAKRRAARSTGNEPITLSTGVKARFIPVSVSVITEAQAAIPDPKVPMWFNEAKGKEEPNPAHPDYERALKATENERNLAAIDALIMFGIELLDGVPNDDRWVKTLKMRERLNLTTVKLSDYDLEDDFDREFLYKKYFAVSAVDVSSLMQFSGVSEEDIAEAARSFQDNQA